MGQKYLNKQCWPSISYTTVCQPVEGDNPQALESELSLVQVGKGDITILYHPHRFRPYSV